MESLESGSEVRTEIKFLFVLLALLIAVPASQAEDLFDWLKPTTHGKKQSQKQGEADVSDRAVLLTLEPGEAETYPKLSKDGRSMLVIASRGNRAWVSRRAVENGDPLNVVSEDARALGSSRWHGGEVTFLSSRAGGLGLWKKAADGQGVVKRMKELHGPLIQPIYLADGSVIAVRLDSVGNTRKKMKAKRDSFNNWHLSGYTSRIILVNQQGSERVLSEGSNPSLSPDGEWIVFSMPVGRSWHLFMMRTDGSELSQLTDVRSIDVQPTWSSDGKWIVFTSNRAKADMRKPANNSWDVWAIDREGRNLTQLTIDKARDAGPSVGADNRVYFHSDRKVSAGLKKERQVKGGTGKFHIWSVTLP